MSAPDNNVERNRQLLLDRSLAGLQKYGVTTERGDLTHAQWMRHLLEELLDAANYVQAAMNNPAPQKINITGDKNKVTVTRSVLKQLLTALIGSPHLIRELQATMHPHSLFPDNPINVLIDEFAAKEGNHD